MTYYISDLHFGHKNVLAYDNREFPDVETHDAEIVRRWNDTVSPSDTVWILGDISWYGPQKTTDLFDSMNGIKNLCVGNHDGRLMKSKDVRDRFCEIVQYKEIVFDDGIGVVLCHYPIPCFNGHFKGWVHLYGHVHNSFKQNMMKQARYQMEELYEKPCRMFNVGCMMPYMDYRPRTLSEILLLEEAAGRSDT